MNSSVLFHDQLTSFLAIAQHVADEYDLKMAMNNINEAMTEFLIDRNDQFLDAAIKYDESTAMAYADSEMAFNEELNAIEVQFNFDVNGQQLRYIGDDFATDAKSLVDYMGGAYIGHEIVTHDNHADWDY